MHSSEGDVDGSGEGEGERERERYGTATVTVICPPARAGQEPAGPVCPGERGQADVRSFKSMAHMLLSLSRCRACLPPGSRDKSITVSTLNAPVSHPRLTEELLLAIGLVRAIAHLSLHGIVPFAPGTLFETRYRMCPQPGPTRNAMASTIGTEMHTLGSCLSHTNHRRARCVGNDWSEQLPAVETLTARSCSSAVINTRCVRAIVLSSSQLRAFSGVPEQVVYLRATKRYPGCRRKSSSVAVGRGVRGCASYRKKFDVRLFFEGLIGLRYLAHVESPVSLPHGLFLDLKTMYMNISTQYASPPHIGISMFF